MAKTTKRCERRRDFETASPSPSLKRANLFSFRYLLNRLSLLQAGHGFPVETSEPPFPRCVLQFPNLMSLTLGNIPVIIKRTLKYTDPPATLAVTLSSLLVPSVPLYVTALEPEHTLSELERREFSHRMEVRSVSCADAHRETAGCISRDFIPNRGPNFYFSCWCEIVTNSRSVSVAQSTRPLVPPRPQRFEEDNSYQPSRFFGCLPRINREPSDPATPHCSRHA